MTTLTVRRHPQLWMMKSLHVTPFSAIPQETVQNAFPQIRLGMPSVMFQIRRRHSRSVLSALLVSTTQVYLPAKDHVLKHPSVMVSVLRWYLDSCFLRSSVLCCFIVTEERQPPTVGSGSSNTASSNADTVTAIAVPILIVVIVLAVVGTFHFARKIKYGSLSNDVCLVVIVSD